MLTHLSLKVRASLACAYSGIAWGLFWIPLRGMDSAGVTDAWATVLFYAVPLLLFTVNDGSTARRHLDGGVRATITDQPREVLAALA